MCSFCGKELSSASNLRAHVRRTHNVGVAKLVAGRKPRDIAPEVRGMIKKRRFKDYYEQHGDEVQSLML